MPRPSSGYQSATIAAAPKRQRVAIDHTRMILGAAEHAIEECGQPLRRCSKLGHGRHYLAHFLVIDWVKRIDPLSIDKGLLGTLRVRDGAALGPRQRQGSRR